MRIRVEIVVFVFLNTVGKELSVDLLDFQIFPLFGLACLLVLHVAGCKQKKCGEATNSKTAKVTQK